MIFFVLYTSLGPKVVGVAQVNMSPFLAPVLYVGQAVSNLAYSLVHWRMCQTFLCITSTPDCAIMCDLCCGLFMGLVFTYQIYSVMEICSTKIWHILYFCMTKRKVSDLSFWIRWSVEIKTALHHTSLLNHIQGMWFQTILQVWYFCCMFSDIFVQNISNSWFTK